MTGRLKAAVDTMGEVAAIYVALLVLGAALFSYQEGVSFGDSLYWAGITAPSVGYGDITPKTGLGKFYAVMIAHLGVIGIAIFTARLFVKITHDHDAFTHEEQVEIMTILRELKETKNG